MPDMTTCLPPGPPLPAALQTLLFFRCPLPFVRGCQQRYGDVFTLRLVFEGQVVYLADPEGIAELFSRDGREAHAGEANSVLEPVTGAHSVLLLDRDAHLRERRLLAPSFHGEAIGELETLARTATERELARWGDEAVVAMRPAMQRITFEIICKAVLGIDDPARREELLSALGPVFDIPPSVLVPPLQVDLGPLTPWRRFQRAMKRLDRMLYGLIAERRAGAPRPDILGMMLAADVEGGGRLSDKMVRDELVTLLLAGHETTATALAWALERLAHHQTILAEVRQSLRAGEPELLEAVAAETLRLRPVVMDVARRLSVPLELCGYRLGAGTVVMPAIYLVHRDQRRYADPGAFYPQRFLEQRPSREVWLPFGGGRRRCLGAALAQMELRVVLGAVLAQYLVEPCSRRPEGMRLRGLTLAPARGAKLAVRRKPLANS